MAKGPRFQSGKTLGKTVKTQTVIPQDLSLVSSSVSLALLKLQIRINQESANTCVGISGLILCLLTSDTGDRR